MPKLRFRGGAGTVTGSCFLLETERLRLVVDCGLFQGNRELRLLNYRNPLVPLNTIDPQNARIRNCRSSSWPCKKGRRGSPCPNRQGTNGGFDAVDFDAAEKNI